MTKPVRFPRLEPRVAALCRSAKDVQRYCREADFQTKIDQLAGKMRLKDLIGLDR
jgi:hypothetical protein